MENEGRIKMSPLLVFYLSSFGDIGMSTFFVLMLYNFNEWVIQSHRDEIFIPL